MNHGTVSLCVIALFSLSGAGCDDPPPPDPNAIVIGALLPFTGDQAASGINLELAALLAAEQINDLGGVGGRPIRIVSRDTHTDLDRGRAALEDLLNEGAVAILGP